MNDREQVLMEREYVRRGFFPPDSIPDPIESTKERARDIRNLYLALCDAGFEPQEALLLTGRLYRD